jgi:hypothetical protein
MVLHRYPDNPFEIHFTFFSGEPPGKRRFDARRLSGGELL